MDTPGERADVLVPFDMVFEPSTVVASLAATTKPEALTELVAAIGAAKGLDEDAVSKIHGRLMKRERMGTTALGRGCAVPHIKWEGTSSFVGAIGYSADGIDFESLDGSPTKVVFVVVGPSDRPAEYLNLMTRLARAVQKDDFMPFVASCRTPQDFIDLLIEMDA